ncbi:MAG: hypothetical protein KAQ79_17505, partial [Cyclobacteriaceae bacterium]|nr:hypothetical protein [Cyclobacteriaceae bacterium]
MKIKDTLALIKTTRRQRSLYVLLTIFIVGGMFRNLKAQEISRSFELRYFAPDAKANGETDFKGKTEYFDTKKRVEYLEAYEQYARGFFKNPDWDKLVVTDDEAKERATNIKPQPLPKVRNRMLLNDWKCLGYKDGQHKERLSEIEKWNAYKDLVVKDENLLFQNKTEFSVP